MTDSIEIYKELQEIKQGVFFLIEKLTEAEKKNNKKEDKKVK